eukprot:365605-Chlamydomonas_euryale.AAC.5
MREEAVGERAAVRANRPRLCRWLGAHHGHADAERAELHTCVARVCHTQPHLNLAVHPRPGSTRLPSPRQAQPPLHTHRAVIRKLRRQVDWQHATIAVRHVATAAAAVDAPRRRRRLALPPVGRAVCFVPLAAGPRLQHPECDVAKRVEPGVRLGFGVGALPLPPRRRRVTRKCEAEAGVQLRRVWKMCGAGCEVARVADAGWMRRRGVARRCGGEARLRVRQVWGE